MKKHLIRDVEHQIQFIDLQLFVLDAFLKDLKNVKLETAMEKALVMEVKDFIAAKKNSLPSVFNFWIPRMILKRQIDRIDDGFRGLYEAKEKYGFKFVRRQQQSLPHQTKYHPDDTKAESDPSMEISRIEYLIQLIHRSVDVYRIEEIRQKPSSLIGLEEDEHALVSQLINEPYPVVSIVDYSDNALHDDVANQVPRTNWLEEVKVSLKEKKCLLVLDNISTKEAWNSVQAEFSKKEDGSKILLTTRDRKVASHASQNPTAHHLRLRTKEESWQLFIHKVQFPPDLPSEVEALPTAKKLVEICGGLPRAIDILVDKISGKGVTGPCYSPVAGSQPIPADGNETVDDVAEKKLLELIDLNIIRVVQKKINGKIKTCQLPGFLRERCLSKFARYSNLHSFLSFDFREGNKPGEDIGNFLRRTIASFQLLRVLDLELVFRQQLPDSIGNLIELRYLGLRWTYLETIPSSIGKLLNLHTLDVKHTCLRELEIRSCKRLEVPTGLNHLKSLLELTLTDMPENFAETIKEKRNDIFRSDVASFPVITIKKLASS
ncbi:probable disease resistance RPP8-like protein 4 [Juglans regia]|uniref:Probable disease resistance RPP8-like protein 4 n=1 Tax=Juglans regia TaxID=51240 RepID=A0A6P9EY13_JUGRE|nr:probable disease resistance RPP8-like protein 4 [Juglans regia]